MIQEDKKADSILLEAQRSVFRMLQTFVEQPTQLRQAIFLECVECFLGFDLLKNLNIRSYDCNAPGLLLGRCRKQTQTTKYTKHTKRLLSRSVIFFELPLHGQISHPTGIRSSMVVLPSMLPFFSIIMPKASSVSIPEKSKSICSSGSIAAGSMTAGVSSVGSET